MTNAQLTYRALLDHEILGRKLLPAEREGMAAEIGRLTEKKRDARECKLLTRYRKALL